MVAVGTRLVIALVTVVPEEMEELITPRETAMIPIIPAMTRREIAVDLTMPRVERERTGAMNATRWN